MFKITKKQPVGNSDAPKGEPLENAATNDVAFSANSPIEDDGFVLDQKSDAVTAPTETEDALPGIVDPDDDDEANPDGASELTEDAAAELFVSRHGKRFRFDHNAERWFDWAGSRWKKSTTRDAFHAARMLLREIRGPSPRMASRKATEGVEAMAARDPRLAVTAEAWNSDPMLLGTPDGTVDLKTGKLSDPDPEDYITKLTSVAPATVGTPCSHFKTFLHQATKGDATVQRFLQQFVGYCLTGRTIEHVLLFVYGPGGNGKSVLQQVILDILGDYAVTAAMETFADSRHDRHPTELAMLHGARFVGVSETEKAQRWAEARINQLTGGDLVTARFMRQDFFSFRPQFKLLIIGNHKPQLNGVNAAARRRFRIVEFVHKPDKPDLKLPEKLRAEYPAILRWMIDGCLDWQQNGLTLPASVKEATENYFAEQDTLANWIEACCETGPDKNASSTALYTSWKAYAEESGEYPGSQKVFAGMLSENGFKNYKSNGIRYLGIAPKSMS